MKEYGVKLKYLAAMVALCFALVSLEGCGAANPVKAAQTVDQKAYAIYGEFTVAEEQAAIFVHSADATPEFKSAIKSADAAAKPVVDAMLAAVLEVTAIRAQLSEGATTEAKLAIATANLQKWVDDAVPLVAALRSAFKGGH